MRLFLSSERLGKFGSKLPELVGKGKNAVYIMNAADLKPNRQEYALSVKADLEALGFNATELDLRQFFDGKQDIGELLSAQDLVWVAGGNTFVLNRAMQQSGFKQAVQPLVQRDKLVFGGWSAGAIIATPSLHGTEWGDNPEVVPDGYPSEIIWEGLGLVPFYIIPHYNSDWRGDKARLMEKYLKEQQLPFEILEDGQVVIVKDDHVEKLI